MGLLNDRGLEPQLQGQANCERSELSSGEGETCVRAASTKEALRPTSI